MKTFKVTLILTSDQLQELVLNFSAEILEVIPHETIDEKAPPKRRKPAFNAGKRHINALLRIAVNANADQLAQHSQRVVLNAISALKDIDKGIQRTQLNHTAKAALIGSNYRESGASPIISDLIKSGMLIEVTQ